MAEEKEKQEPGEQIGTITNYFKNVKAASIRLDAPLKKGDQIRIIGGDKDFELTVDSMQIHRKDIEEAKAGDEIGVLVPEDVHKGYKVYKIE